MEGHLLPFGFHLFPSWLFDPAKCGSVKFTARAPEDVSSSESTGSKPPQNTLVCVTLRKWSVPLGLSFPLCKMGIMPGVGNTFSPRVCRIS